MRPEIILCDIDGTVADCRHRLHFIDNIIRVGDTVYPKNIPSAKQRKGTVLAVTDQTWIKVAWEKPVADWPFPITYNSAGHTISKKLNYLKFFESAKDDPPIQTMIDIINVLGPKYPIIFCSGRPAQYRKQTYEWLLEHGLSWPNAVNLFMRPSGDMRPDHIVKKELYLTHIEPRYKVKCVFDDRSSVVAMWRSLGLQCYQVAEGNF